MEKFTIDLGKNIGKADFWCRSRDTRSGFAHDCVVPSLGVKAKISYLNRTWECYQFQSVIHSAVEKIVKDNLGLKGKKNAKEVERVYNSICDKVDKLHAAKGFEYHPSEQRIFGN